MEYRKEYEQWLQDPYLDRKTHEELLSLAGNEKEIEDRFYRQLEFGTGGLRGIIGAGTNRMNIYTVRRATQGLANYIKSQKGQQKGVAIAFDSRNMSAEFSREAALCLNANGIKTYRFQTLHPTPELSFAVRELGCIAGIVITASHNPREYNGYKVYWEDGAQITPPHDRNIMREVEKVTSFYEIKTMSEEQAVAEGLYQVIGQEIDDLYIANVKGQGLHPELIEKEAENIRIVYSPLNGAGNIPVRRVLQELGFKKVYVVPKQEAADGDFPTLPYPNPEEPQAWTLALKLAQKKNADLVLTTDPDADRLGVYCKGKAEGEYICFTGNMCGVLIADYILQGRTNMGTMPENPALVETIVTTNMVKAIAKKYHVDVIETLTGFKYIGEQIRKFEETGDHNFVFGLEESYGCLTGTYTRDKDAVVAVMLVCEMAAFYKSQGKTLWDRMEELYRQYGYYKEDMASVILNGPDGIKDIQGIMDRFRKVSKNVLGENRVLSVRDYKEGLCRELITRKQKILPLPKSNVIYYELEHNAWCCVRPSGTEPKIKFYFGVCGESERDAENKLQKLKEDIFNIAAI